MRKGQVHGVFEEEGSIIMIDHTNVESIKNKKILFFLPDFFEYKDLIVRQMREMGAEVDAYDARAVRSALSRALLKILPGIFYLKTNKYYKKIIKLNIDKDYDYILIVKCDMTPSKILREFKTVFPHAKLCLYLWDSINNTPGVVRKFKYFDTLHSFDKSDCKNYKELKFRPLFFCGQFRKDCKDLVDCKYDICFIGTVHSDRYAVINQVQKFAKERGLSCFWFLYLQSKFIFYFYKIVKKEFRFATKGMFSYRKMPSAEIAKIVNESRVILDIQHPNQTGLTMRTIEMIGMNKKVLTTNSDILEYDFYNANNISVIDRNKVDISEEFLKSKYFPLSKEIYENYSLESWVYDVLS